MTRADLHLVPDPDPSLGDAIAWAYNGDATQEAVDRADEHVTRHEDDDYGDTDTVRYQTRVRVLRDQLRAERGKQ